MDPELVAKANPGVYSRSLDETTFIGLDETVRWLRDLMHKHRLM